MTVTVIPLRTFYGFSMVGYNGLNRYVVNVRHQHQLQQSLQVRGWVPLVGAVLLVKEEDRKRVRVTAYQ